MLRHDGRTSTQMRPIKITPHFTKNPAGSVLIEFGDTRVLCTVCVDDNVPPFLRNVSPPKGWLTAEYSMLPSSTQTRTRRERPSPSGRSQEIQRLIGRSLRGIIDLNLCPDMTFLIDCDVLQADGGTRTASITGAYVALKICIDQLLRTGRLKQNPLKDAVCAVAIGLREDEILVDLDYEEDSQVDLDMNVILTQSGKILEIQGTAERQAFTKEQVNKIIDAAESALEPCFELQATAADGIEVEG